MNLVGHSTDSAGFSLSALVTLMTPKKATVNDGVIYLGLCIPDEKFVGPYSGPYRVLHTETLTT